MTPNTHTTLGFARLGEHSREMADGQKTVAGAAISQKCIEITGKSLWPSPKETEKICWVSYGTSILDVQLRTLAVKLAAPSVQKELQ